VKATLRRIESGEQIELSGLSIIGRSSESQIMVNDRRVSRRHAMIRKQNGSFYIFDLGSFNGSYLNGTRITAARQLNNGDTLTFAEHEFEFEHEGVQDLGLREEDTIAMIRSTPVVILVSDVIGFTLLSEEMDAGSVAQIIGRWYSNCEETITKEGGTVDKFIGDSVLAYWTKVDQNTLLAAMRTAKALKAITEKIGRENFEILEKTKQKFQIGTALHTGKVAYGGMSQGEFTLLGDPVNLAFRLESLTRDLPYEVLMSGAFARSLPSPQEFGVTLGVQKVKGRSQGVEIFGVTSFPK
jgi:adenylate cyclase